MYARKGRQADGRGKERLFGIRQVSTVLNPCQWSFGPTYSAEQLLCRTRSRFCGVLRSSITPSGNHRMHPILLPTCIFPRHTSVRIRSTVLDLQLDESGLSLPCHWKQSANAATHPLSSNTCLWPNLVTAHFSTVVRAEPRALSTWAQNHSRTKKVDCAYNQDLVLAHIGHTQ